MLGAPSRHKLCLCQSSPLVCDVIALHRTCCWDLNGTLALCPFVLQLEDDIVAKPNYLSTMKNFALQQPSEEWMILEFSQLGFIGNVLPTHRSPIRHKSLLALASATFLAQETVSTRW